MTAERQALPVLALLYAAAFWGVVWYPLRELESLGMAGVWQTLVSYLAATLTIALIRGVRMRGWRAQPLDALTLLLASGWTNVAFVLAVLDGEVVRVLMLFYLSPLWATLLGRFLLGERLLLSTWLMVVLGLSGAATMLWEPQAMEKGVAAADWFAISAGLAFAVTNVSTRRLTAISVVGKTQIAWLGVVVVSLLMIVLGESPVPDTSPVAWGGATLLGILGFLFSTLAVVYGVSRMPVQKSSVIMLFEILVGSLSAWWLAGEVPLTREWVGGAMIIAAGLVAIVRNEDANRHVRRD